MVVATDTVIYDQPNSTTVIGELTEGQQVDGDIIRFGAWVQLRNGGYALKRYLRQPKTHAQMAEDESLDKSLAEYFDDEVDHDNN